MTRQEAKNGTVREMAGPVAAVLLGVLLALSASPRSAAASASVLEDGYKCTAQDKCGPGGALCCDDVRFDHCTTMCDGGPGQT